MEVLRECGDPCLTAAASIGTFVILALFTALFFVGSFVVVRLLWVAFHWRNQWTEDKHIAKIARAQVGAMAWEKQNTTDTTLYIRQLYDNLEAEKERRRIEAERASPYNGSR